MGSFHFKARRLNLPWEQVPQLPTFSTSLVHRVWLYSSGIILLSMVVLGWPSLLCHNPVLLGVSALNEVSKSTRCVQPRLASNGGMPSLFMTFDLLSGTSLTTIHWLGLGLVALLGDGGVWILRKCGLGGGLS